MKKDLKKMLEEKLQQNNQRHTLATQSVEFSEGREYDLVPIEKIYPNPYQPRRIFPQEEIDKLANSISEIGLLEPILLRKYEEHAMFDFLGQNQVIKMQNRMSQNPIEKRS